ncbi:putative Ras-related protein Rab-33 [Watersipora subatra]|uniref:putative Ras-related protein Rab-33 n=1 Tax=Watersipora subatra TaxID=2589382 RepID=UPI00355B6B9C
MSSSTETSTLSAANENNETSEIKTVKATERLKEAKIFKIIVIGDSNVGKTCLTYRFCEGKFPNKVEATIGVDFREKTVEIGDELLKLQLWDTAGQERFRKSMVPHYYRNVHAVVYVYDVTKRSTFDSLTDWLSEYNRHNFNHAKVPRILVGNKCEHPELSVVPTYEAQRFADMNGMPAFETSAMDDSKSDHIDSIFMTLAHKLKESKPMMGSKYGSSRKPQPNTTTLSYSPIGQEKKSSCPC